MTIFEWGVVAVIGLVGLCVLVAFAPLVLLHVRSRAAGVPVPMVELIGMHLRQTNPRRVVNARIRSFRSGLDLPTTSLEVHAVAGGDFDAVVDALIEAKRKGMALAWNEAAAYDLAGGDVVGAVRAGVTPRVGVRDGIPRRSR